jgi:hypothetical protein
VENVDAGNMATREANEPKHVTGYGDEVSDSVSNRCDFSAGTVLYLEVVVNLISYK